ncbi:MAG: HAMP domain-containing sensor histidine kinase [Paenisporosarcina sp.]
MMFPFSVGEGLSFDLRRIPFILGILYGGPKIGVLLLAFVITTRGLIGIDIGFYLTIVTFTTMTIILSFISRYYVKLSLYKKLVVSGLLISASIQGTFFLMVFSMIDLSIYMWLQYFTINFIATIMGTLLIEIIRMNAELLEKLMKAEKLKVVSHLAASISHEVRNPLTSCKGFLQLSHEEETSPIVRDYLEISIKELDRASNIINDYLTFAKPAPETMEKVSICKEIQKVVNILTPLANMSNVQLKWSKGDLFEYHILGNRKRLQQSLINIVKNGIESMDVGGELEIKLSSDYSSVRIEIRDEGKGMSQHQINRLGEPYFTTKENGTGLGMMVSFSLIKGMGGQVNVDSEVGKWTLFSIEFPVVQ